MRARLVLSRSMPDGCAFGKEPLLALERMYSNAIGGGGTELSWQIFVLL